MRSVRTGKEVWHIFVTRGGLLFSSFALLLFIFIGLLTLIAYTSIIDLVPGYPGNRSRELLIQSVVRLDSLEREIGLWERYTNDLQAVLDGRHIEHFSTTNDSLKPMEKVLITPRSKLDSALRESVAMRSKMDDNTSRRMKEFTFEMIAPITGNITSKFSPQEGNFGVTLSPKPNSVVLSVMDGTVIVNNWTPNEGWIVGIQHSGSMISFYKGLQRAMKGIGSRVKAGEGIGVSEVVTESSSPIFSFELWASGNAIDPENYITFGSMVND